MGDLMKKLSDYTNNHVQSDSQIFRSIEIYISEDISVRIDYQLCIEDKDRKLYIGCSGVQDKRNGNIVYHSDIFEKSSLLYGYSRQELTELYNTIINNLFTQWHLK